MAAADVEGATRTRTAAEEESGCVLSDRDYHTACQLATAGKTKQLKEFLQDTLRKRRAGPLTFRSNHASVSRKFSPLALAARYGRVDTVKWLLTAYRKALDLNPGANDSEVAKELRHDLPLYWASLEGHLEVAKLLVSAGARVNLPNCMQATALHAAATSGHLRVMEYLIGRGADVNASDHLGTTPLMAAASRGHIEAVAFLLSKGACTATVTAEGYTAMHTAAENGHTNIVETLLHAGVPPMFQEAGTENCVPCPLFLAAANGHVDTVATLLSLPECSESCRLDAVTLLSIGAHQFTYRPTEHHFMFEDGSVKSIHDSEQCNAILERCLGPGHVITPTIFHKWRRKTYRRLSLDLYFERYRYENAALHKTISRWQEQMRCSIYPDPVHVQTLLRAHFFNTWSKLSQVDVPLLQALLSLATDALEVLRDLQERHMCEVIGGLDESLLTSVLNILTVWLSEDYRRQEHRLVSLEAFVCPRECEEFGRGFVGNFLTFAVGTSLLHLAASQLSSQWQSCPQAVSVLLHCLLRWGATRAIDLPDWNGDRPLHLVVQYHHPEVALARVSLLLRNGAHPDHVNRLGRTPLELCSETFRRPFRDAVKTLCGPPRLVCIACLMILKEGIPYEHLDISPAVKRVISEHDSRI